MMETEPRPQDALFPRLARSESCGAVRGTADASAGGSCSPACAADTALLRLVVSAGAEKTSSRTCCRTCAGGTGGTWLPCRSHHSSDRSCPA